MPTAPWRQSNAIREDAQGDISLEDDQRSNDAIAWSVPRGGGYMQTPIIYGDYLYVSRNNGVLSCFRAQNWRTNVRKAASEREPPDSPPRWSRPTAGSI